MGRGTERLCSLLTHTYPVSPRAHQRETLRTPSLWVSLEASLPRHDWLNHWPLLTDLNLQSLCPPQRSGSGAESSNPLITWLVPLVNSSLVERDLLWTTKDIFISIITYEIPRVLGALWQELDKGQIYISYPNMYFLNHDITTSHPSPGSLALLLMTQFSYCLYSWSLLCSYSLCFLHALFYWWLNMNYTNYLFPCLLLPPSWASWAYRPLAHLVNITKFGKPWEVDCWINEWTHACYFLYTYEIANISHIQWLYQMIDTEGTFVSSQNYEYPKKDYFLFIIIILLPGNQRKLCDIREFYTPETWFILYSLREYVSLIWAFRANSKLVATYFPVFLFIQKCLCCCFSVAKLCLTLCNSIDCLTPGLTVPHYLLELVQVLIRWISDAIQPPHPLPPSSPFAFNLSKHQGLFQ